MPRRSPPASGAIPSFAIAARIRFSARRVRRTPFAPSLSPSAVSTGDAGSAGVTAAAAAPFGVSDWSVTKDILPQNLLLYTAVRHSSPVPQSASEPVAIQISEQPQQQPIPL